MHKASLLNLTLIAVTYINPNCLSNLNDIDGSQKKNPLNSRKNRIILSLQPCDLVLAQHQGVISSLPVLYS